MASNLKNSTIRTPVSYMLRIHKSHNVIIIAITGVFFPQPHAYICMIGPLIASGTRHNTTVWWAATNGGRRALVLLWPGLYRA